jgi:hypothetical protein
LALNICYLGLCLIWHFVNFLWQIGLFGQNKEENISCPVHNNMYVTVIGCGAVAPLLYLCLCVLTEEFGQVSEW